MMDRLDRVCRISRRAVQESLSGLIRSNFTVGDCNNTIVGRGIGVRLPFGVEGGHGVINGRRVTRLIDRRVGSKSDVVLSTDSATICITGVLLSLFRGHLYGVRYYEAYVGRSTIPVFSLFARRFHGVLFAGGVTVLSSIRQGLSVRVFVSRNATVTFCNRAILGRFVRISSSYLLKGLMGLARFTCCGSSIILRFFWCFVSSLCHGRLATSYPGSGVVLLMLGCGSLERWDEIRCGVTSQV